LVAPLHPHPLRCSEEYRWVKIVGPAHARNFWAVAVFAAGCGDRAILELLYDVVGPVGLTIIIGAVVVIAVEAARWLLD
jgi:hypothetical protein